MHQKIWEPELLSHRGVHLWTSFVYGWEEEIVTFPYYWNGGLIWQGPIEAARHDTGRSDYAQGWFSESLAGQSRETTLECSYSWYVNDVLTVTPDLQYIVQPAGTGAVPDALLLGVLMYITY